MNLRRMIINAFSTGLFPIMFLLVLPHISAGQEKIAFASNRDGNYEIYAMNANGSNQARLTNNAASDYGPAFSRDGSKIAFFSDREGVFKIYVMNDDGTNLVRLTNNAQDDHSPSFSPGGSKIVFVSNRDGNPEIYVMNADGTGQTRLTNDPGNDAKPSFSHDSTKIVFESLRAGNNDIYKIDADGSNLLRLTNDPGNDGNPTFRPDRSNRIVFHSNRDGNYEIYDMFGDGSDQVSLTNNSADDLNPTYSRNGNRVTFESSRDGNSEIYDMYTNGNDQTRLTNNPAGDTLPSCGGFPVVQTVVPINGVTPTLNEITIDNSAGDQFDPHVSGDWVAYTTETPSYSIRYYNFATNTGAEIPHTASEFDLLSEIKGSKIVFSRSIFGAGTKVMIFDAATPAVAPALLTTTPGDIQFDCSIGGNTVAFIDYGTHSNGDLVVHDLISAVTTRLTNESGPQYNLEGPEVSDDGNVVVWTRGRTTPYLNHSEIWQAVKTAGMWKVSIVSTGPEDRLDFDSDTNGSIVTYGSRRGGTVFNSSVVWRSITGGPETRLDSPLITFDPNITGNYITFIATSDLIAEAYDVYLYDIVHNRLYRITNTPGNYEDLSEVTVLPDGRIRMVWASGEDGVDQRNIHGATFTVPSTDTTPPVIDPIANVVVNLPLNSTATSTPVTFPLPTVTDDSGTVTVTTNPVSGSVFPLGASTVNVTATDGSSNTATGSFTVTVLHNFSGFLQPVDAFPILNLVGAGQAVPVKFSLSGNKGLSIFAAGYPTSGVIACDVNDPGVAIEETVTAGGSSLSYSAAADQYSYVWKTDKAWKGTCRILDVRLKDGTDHFAKFRFK